MLWAVSLQQVLKLAMVKESVIDIASVSKL